jgi:hypothetical protein
MPCDTALQRMGFSEIFMENTLDSKRVTSKKKLLRIIAGLLVLGFATLALFVLFPALPDPTCAALIVCSIRDVAIPLPQNCRLIREVPRDPMVEYLAEDRIRRGLVHKSWVICEPVISGLGFGHNFENDTRWLPSYVPDTYEFRRTVVILPHRYSHPTPRSDVVAEVTKLPWSRYLSQIAGQCDGKYSVWR